MIPLLEEYIHVKKSKIFIDAFFEKILMIKQSCNLIGKEHLSIYVMK